MKLQVTYTINEHDGSLFCIISASLLKEMLRELDHWLHSLIDTVELCDIDSTNRVEAFLIIVKTSNVIIF